MSLPVVEFSFHDMLTARRLGSLKFTDWSFNDPLGGVGQFSGTLPITEANRDFIRDIIKPNLSAVYAKVGDVYLWGGIVTGRPWKRSTSTLTIKATQWEGYWYRRFVLNRYYKASIEQMQATREMLSTAMADIGTPRVTLDTASSGVLRQVTVEPWTTVGDALDSVANRDNGFDWSIQIRNNSQTGLPELYLAQWYPERQSQTDVLGVTIESRKELIESLQSGGNANVDDWPEDAIQAATRVWATGDGSPPDQPIAKDEDPDLTDGFLPLFESVTNWFGVTSKAVLADHARSERMDRALPLQTLPADLPVDTPRIEEYLVGDRARVVIKDEWLDIDLPAVRIIDRAISSDQTSGMKATVLLDLTDYEAPAL